MKELIEEFKHDLPLFREMTEKFYRKETGEHLAFIPVHICKNKRCIFVGEALFFGADESYKKEKEKIYNRLKEEFLHMENQSLS